MRGPTTTDPSRRPSTNYPKRGQTEVAPSEGPYQKGSSWEPDYSVSLVRGRGRGGGEEVGGAGCLQRITSWGSTILVTFFSAQYLVGGGRPSGDCSYWRARPVGDCTYWRARPAGDCTYWGATCWGLHLLGAPPAGDCTYWGVRGGGFYLSWPGKGREGRGGVSSPGLWLGPREEIVLC